MRARGRRGQVVGRGEAPFSRRFIELEGVVFPVVVVVRSQHVEEHAAGEFFDLRGGGMQANGSSEQIAVVERIGCLVQQVARGMKMDALLKGGAPEHIEACDEEVAAVGIGSFRDQIRLHGADARIPGHHRVGELPSLKAMSVPEASRLSARHAASLGTCSMSPPELPAATC